MDADGFTLVTRKNQHKKKGPPPSTAAAAHSTPAKADSSGKRNLLVEGGPPSEHCSSVAAGFTFVDAGADRSKRSRRWRRHRQGPAAPETRHSALLAKFHKVRRIVSASPMVEAMRNLLLPRLVLAGCGGGDAAAASSEAAGPKSSVEVHLTAYGVGNFDGSSTGCFQLAFADIIRKEVLAACLSRAAVDSTQHPSNEERLAQLAEAAAVEDISSSPSAEAGASRHAAAPPASAAPRVRMLFYDPVSTEDEAAFLNECLDVEVLADGNDRARRPLDPSAGERACCCRRSCCLPSRFRAHPRR